MSFNFIIRALMPDLDTYWHPNPHEFCISCVFVHYWDSIFHLYQVVRFSLVKMLNSGNVGCRNTPLKAYSMQIALFCSCKHSLKLWLKWKFAFLTGLTSLHCTNGKGTKRKCKISSSEIARVHNHDLQSPE